MTARDCIACGQSDTDPRHVTVLSDGQEAPVHMDCHSRMGCEICSDAIAGADGATGDALRTYLMQGK